jgi:hypothetical protein
MSSSPDEQAKDGLPDRLGRAMDRRTFFSTSALLGLGFAAGCSAVGRDWNGVVAGPSMLEALPDGNARALEIYDASPTARELGAWLERFALKQEPARALLFDVPAVTDLPKEVTAEDRPSLIGESAYKTFQNDSFAKERFTGDQMASISTVARVDMASEIGSLIQNGGAVLAMACCCCCCCCSLCCCSCNNGDNGGSSQSAKFQVAAVPFGDPTIEYAGEVRAYFRGMMGVQDNGEAVAIVESVTNDPEMTVADITIGVLDRETREVRAFRFTPQELDELGPKALAERLFTAA